jgi:hypothetical protein
MKSLSEDAYIAIILLFVSGILFWQTFNIRTPDYGVLLPSTWPRIGIALLALLSIIYLIQSLKSVPTNDGQSEEKPAADRDPGFAGWLKYYQNPLICFGFFFLYLVTLPFLGSLIGGVLFVFGLMTAIGGHTLKDMAIHLILALIIVGGVWAIFTFGLEVILPTGEIYNPFA